MAGPRRDPPRRYWLPHDAEGALVGDSGWRALPAVAADGSQNSVDVRTRDGATRHDHGYLTVSPLRPSDPDGLVVSVDGREQFVAERGDLVGGWLRTLDGADYFNLDLDFGWGDVRIGDEVIGGRVAVPRGAASWTGRPGFADREGVMSLLSHIAAAHPSDPVAIDWFSRDGTRAVADGRLSIDAELFTAAVRIDDRELLGLRPEWIRGGWSDVGRDGRRVLCVDTGIAHGRGSRILWVGWGVPDMAG